MIALASFFLVFPQAAHATTFMVFPFPKVVRETQMVVRGTVGSSYADWGEESPGDRRIFTFVEVRVGEVLKGEAPARDLLIARQPGGERDGVGMEVAGTARLSRGEDVVLMLGPVNADGSYDIQNLMLGKLVVQRDPESGEEVLSGPALAKPGIRGTHGDTPHEERTGAVWTLARLRGLIQEQSQAQSQAPDGADSSGESPAKRSPPSDGGKPKPQAPPLQPQMEGTTGSAPEEGGQTPRRWPVPGLVAGIILALAAGSLYLLRRSRRGR
ncbi:MAG: hypothetical protein IT285_12045 [Bdellovibrionales bacterium]|nr:hypothetical protein [Bdellovibrionales bacterium]